MVTPGSITHGIPLERNIQPQNMPYLNELHAQTLQCC